MPPYKQVTYEVADMLWESGNDVCFRFKNWPDCEFRPFSKRATLEAKSPSDLAYRWDEGDRPEFYSEVE